MLTIVLAGACWGTYLLLLRLIDQQAWRWKKAGRTSPPARRPTATTTGRARRRRRRRQAPDAGQGRRASWAALRPGVRSGTSTWPCSTTSASSRSGRSPTRRVDVGDVLKMALIFFVTAGVWRYLQHVLHRRGLPEDARRPGHPVRGGDALPLRWSWPSACSPGLSAIHLGPGEDRRRPGGAGRRARVRLAGDRLELRQRDHPPAGAADPRGRHRHRRRHDRQGRPDQHPGDHDHQRRQPEHDRPQPPVHHRQPDELDPQGQDRPRRRSA